MPLLSSPKSLNPRSFLRRSAYTELWTKRKISNFDYLMVLNRMAGRSFNDITQYPVFPWVLSDYTSQSIDLSDSRIYRDLSKPIGALNPDRLSQLLERYKDLELFGFTEAEKFLYGSHYSSPGIVLHYMIRQEPFTTMAIELQSGRFDCPDRLFFDIPGSWSSCMTSTSDMKELIPEFYCFPEMFLNTNDFPFGRTQSGRDVNHVGLPPWANGSAYEFVRTHRQALESEYVSQNLNHWIDLVFGYKQRGSEAEAAHNIFHHLSYEGSVDLDKIADELDRKAAESHIQNFGQTPSQLLTIDPHPSRYGYDESWKLLFNNFKIPKKLRSYTPSKQFGNKRSELAKGAVVKLHAFSEVLLVIYSDMSVGTYKWNMESRSDKLKMDRLRLMAQIELSLSKGSIRRGSAIPDQALANKKLDVNNQSFAVTIGGRASELLRQKTLFSSSRVMNSSELTINVTESAAYIVSCGYWDYTIKAHSVDSLKVQSSDSGGHTGPVTCLVASDDGGFIATGSSDGTCRLWTVDHSDLAAGLLDGYIQTALGGRTAKSQVLECFRILWGHDTAVSCIQVNSQLDVVVSGSSSGLICIHTLRQGEFVRSFQPTTHTEKAVSVFRLALHPFGTLVLQTSDFQLAVYNVNGVYINSINAGENLNDLYISPDCKTLVTGGENGQIIVRALPNLQLCTTLDLSRHGPVRSISVSPNEYNYHQVLFVGSEDGMVTIVEEDSSTQRNA